MYEHKATAERLRMEGLGRYAAVCTIITTSFVFGCVRKEPARGQLMVTVTTDAPLPDYVDGIRLVATHEYDGKAEVIFDREPEVAVGAGQLLIPTTLAIVSNGRPTDRVRLKLLARKQGQDRVLRTAITQIPPDRIAELHLPIEWLCDGSATPGDPLYCNDPEYTCAGGKCVPQYIDPATLPNYVPPNTSGDGGMAGAPAGAACFDVAACFADAYAVPVMQAGCSVEIPTGDAAELNLALVVKRERGGQCIPGGNCLVPLARGPLGWSLSASGTRLQLPPAVCTTRAADVIAVVASSRCATKLPATPLCGAWSPFVAPVGQDAGVGADAAPPFALCRNGGDCASGHCADGVCCNEVCAGFCRSCAFPGKQGTCTVAVAGTVDPRGVCVAAGPESCGSDGTCDGQGGCRTWAAGTVCGAMSCTPTNMTPASGPSAQRYACDGAGKCIESATNCTPYGCSSSACLLACRSAADCAAGYACDCVGDGCQTGGRCVGATENGQACSRNEQCREGICVGGLCNRNVLARVTFEGAAGSSIPSEANQIGSGTMRKGLSLNSPATEVELVPGRHGGQALRLDGMDEFVTFLSAPQLNKVVQSGQYTVAAWVKLEAPVDYAWILSRPIDGQPDEQVFGIGHSSTGPAGQDPAAASGSPFAAIANASYSTASGVLMRPGEWVHLASTYDGKDFVFYVNGQVGRSVPITYNLSPHGTPLIIGGGRALEQGFSFRGVIDDVVILDRAVPMQTVAEMMNWR